jgi:bacteriocin biosynthesis cyclodehydratase domain-containing protein
VVRNGLERRPGTLRTLRPRGATPKREFRLLPCQQIDLGDRIVLKRGRTEFVVSGRRAGSLVRRLLDEVGRVGVRRKVVAAFAPGERNEVANLLSALEARGFLAAAGREPASSVESAEDIFYWHFGARPDVVTARISNVHIAVLGVNSVSRQLCTALEASGVRNVSVLDIPALRDPRLFDGHHRLRAACWTGLPRPQRADRSERVLAASRCIVATSETGAPATLREWNEFCLARQCHFLPVVLQDLIGYVGPLLVPGETACYECLCSRQNANLDDWPIRRAVEERVSHGPGVAGSLAPMAMIVADIAALAIVAFYGEVLTTWSPGTLVEVNSLGLRLDSRRVLRVPRCRACSSLRTRSSVDPTETILSFAQIAAQ